MLLYFPHLELVFLLWAFEGTVTVQMTALRFAPHALGFCLVVLSLVSLGRRARQSLVVLQTQHSPCPSAPRGFLEYAVMSSLGVALR